MSLRVPAKKQALDKAKEFPLFEKINNNMTHIVARHDVDVKLLALTEKPDFEIVDEEDST